MRKPDFRLCENKGKDQLRYLDSTIPLLSKLLAVFCGYTCRFVLDLVGNLKTGFLASRTKCLRCLDLQSGLGF